MPDSVRLACCPSSTSPAGSYPGSATITPRDLEWGDSRNVMRGSVVGMGFGTGFWAAIFGLISLLKH